MAGKNKDITVILPCLNEASSVGACVIRARGALRKLRREGYTGEVIVVDNGSTDRSLHIARAAGARVIIQKIRGYGAAYQKGIRVANNYIVMGDSDGSYDFRSVPAFVHELERGADVVLGSRYLGDITAGSMPFFHRYIGNPILTGTINLFFGSHISDSQTGMRAFTKKAYRSMQMKSLGMEFASEMIVKAIAYKLTVKEISINYYKRSGLSKLSPLRDAWRHINAILIYSPTYAFIIPGLTLFSAGIIVTAILLPGPVPVFGHLVDIHTLIMAVLGTSMGLNIVLLGFFTRFYTVQKLGIPGGKLTDIILRQITMARLFILGTILFILALFVIGGITIEWIASNFQSLARERELIAGAGLAMMGTQLLFSSFMFGLLQ